jgi:hypothetical protein
MPKSCLKLPKFALLICKNSFDRMAPIVLNKTYLAASISSFTLPKSINSISSFETFTGILILLDI